MEFFAINGKRPVRLSERTRRFAYDSLNHKYGLDTRKTPYITLDHIADYENMSELERYDCAVGEIVQKAPIRICDGELLSGSATLGDALNHSLPVIYQGKIGGYDSGVSHLTVDFETVLKKGVNHIEQLAQVSYEKYKGTEREPFARSCLHTIDSMRIFHQRYLDALEDQTQYKDNYHNLKNVPFAPAGNFYEAVQSLWFAFAFLRLCGNWPGIGRIDWLLGSYLEKDLADGMLTVGEAREILAHFFIKGCEWITGDGGVFESGDAQHYQNIVLAGVDENGKEVTNAVTYLVLDIIEELGISDFPTTVRINKNTDKELLERVAQVIRLGGGVIAVYNEDLIIDSLVNYGYEIQEARMFANDGCWEIQIPGKTFFTYIAFDSLQVLQQKTLKNYSEEMDFSSFDVLYERFAGDLKDTVEKLMRDRCEGVFQNTDIPVEEWTWKPTNACTVVSLFERGCIEKGLSYAEGGPVYNVVSPHIGGLPDVVDSLYAIKKLVFDDKKVSLAELTDILKHNWEGYEPLRQYALNKYTYFGNDNEEVDAIAARIVKDFADICDEINKYAKHLTPAGISTFGRQLDWAPHRFATPYGKKAHEVLSGNYSPAPGTDKEGATAIIKSYCKANLKRMVSGAALDIKLLPAAVNTENGIEAIMSLIRGFVALGGHFMQLDIADTALLKEAQEHPENYQNLSVRVSGWNARFVTLSKQWQDMIITQTGSDF